MNWQIQEIGKFVDIKHGWAFKGEFFVDNGKYILLSPGNAFETGGLKLKGEKEKFYSGDFPEEYLMTSGDMLVVMTDLMQSAPILGASLVIPENDRFLHNQRLGLVQIKEGANIDKRFLYHLFNTPTYRDQVRATATGATVRHTSPGRICSARMAVPDNIKEQRRVAFVLDAYNGLIAANQRRIQLLEESARLLYREWFVLLKFPGHETVKVKDGVPEGWSKQPLSDLADVIMGQSPESKHFNEDGEGLPFHQGVTGFGERFVIHSTYSTHTTRIAQPGDILCSVRAPVGRLNVTMDKIVIGRGLSAVRSKLGLQSLLFYQLKNLFFQEDLIGGGAIFASVGKKELFSQGLLQPSDEVASTFEKFASGVDQQIEALTIQVRRLEEARDILLPKLMSGALDVSRITVPKEGEI